MAVRYDEIGVSYNQTRKADPYLTKRLIHLLQPVEDGAYLDIGCGTGNYTIEMAKRGYPFIGMDPSIQMLTQAKQKYPKMEWSLGKAENTGIHSGEMDGVVATLTLHHWDNLTEGFLEMERILKPKGKMVIFTSIPEQMKGYWLNHYFPNMMEASCKQMPTYESITDALKSAGFSIGHTEKYFVRPDLEDLFLYSGKQRPHRYLNVEFRQGISSFTMLSNAKEVTQGLKELHEDIVSGKVHDVIDAYDNESGDYLFMVACKS